MRPKFVSTFAARSESEFSALITNDEMMVPISKEPLSPKNIFDFNPKTLWEKNGIKAPTDKTAKEADSLSSAHIKATAKMAQAIIQKPEHKPFTPSIRLIALIMPTHTKTVRGTDI